MTDTIKEPVRKKSSCSYCGDSPVPHGLFYFASLMSFFLDSHITRTTRHAPQLLRNFVDRLIYFTFDTFVFFRLARLSDDVTLARTFRSRVVWEEALRRGIDMKQLILFGKPMDQYRTIKRGRGVYFDSLPIPPERLNMKKNWDDKFILKQELIKSGVPVPGYVEFNTLILPDLSKIFSSLRPPVIVKPRMGSRGRHTVTNIHTLEEFRQAVAIARQIGISLVAEEHLEGDVCRATFVDGRLMGFYRGSVPFIRGDGKHTVKELIDFKDALRGERVEKILVNEEMEKFIKRSGFGMGDVLPSGHLLALTHRTGRLFGGATREMLPLLHPGFTPILARAAETVGLAVIGFDCIIPDPMADPVGQKWGIIECNSLPFIDLHYYALEGKPGNIAGAIWDMWEAS
jgi:cyanophycin synthetase